MTTLPSLIPTQATPTTDRRPQRARILAAALAVLVVAVGTLATVLVLTRGNLDAQRRVSRNLTTQLADTSAKLAATTATLADTRRDLTAAKKDLATTTEDLRQARGDLDDARKDATGAHADARRLAALAKTENMCLERVIQAYQLMNAGNYSGAIVLLDDATIATCQKANRDVSALAGENATA